MTFNSGIDLPVLIEPVVSLGLDLKWIAEVAWTRRSDPVHWAISASDVVDELDVLSLVVLLHDTHGTSLSYNKHG